MSWKPGRGSGCGFDDAMRREEKYRSELNTLMSTPDATKLSQKYIIIFLWH